MKVIITGGSGFIGRAVSAALEAKGHDPIVMDNRSGGDILSAEFPKADAIIHLAGVLGTAELFDTPSLAIDVNVRGTLRVLEACRDQSMAFVGITMPDAFPSIYTATKLAATRLATAFHHAYGIPVSHVRAFNAYGPGQAVGDGHPQKIVPTFAVKAWRGEALPIWGDGRQTIDLVHVDDVARMLVDALAFGDDQVFDAGTGIAMTVNDLAARVLEYTGSFAGVEYLPMRLGEVATGIVAKGEGSDLLGWQPRFNPAQLNETLDWYKEVSGADTLNRLAS